ncbi:MAG: hypothetical protein KGL91_03610 [Xanthomonadaceae bacterium]|nr:hypothetical protein [Xanthomonadaceae bacterium]
MAVLPLVLLALLLQAPLIFNPGYFSHDELQWAVRAIDAGTSPWADTHAFQYRPLTFTVWMALSRAFFDTPMVLHGVLVLWGTLNAVLLYLAGRGFGMSRGPAMAGTLAFILSPYTAYTHGWLGCIADLVWLSGALCLVVLVQRARTMELAAIIAGICTLLALLGKEAAFAIPPLLALAWWFDGRKRVWLAALLAATAVAAVYLGLRMDALLHAPREGMQYSLSLRHVPQRWLEYQLFPMVPGRLETFTLPHHGKQCLLAGVLWLALLMALWQASKRLLPVFLLGGIAALLPVLPLGSSWNHYAYGFAALTTMTVAAAWPTATRAGRFTIAVVALLSALHAGVVMWQIQRVGRIQAVFSPALAQVLRTHPHASVTLQPATDVKPWVFQRLTHDIPGYAGVTIGNRVRLVAADQPADYRITADGQLQPLR